MGVGVGGRRVTVGSAPPVRPAEGWCCMTSYIALSLHENYAPSWKVWEGVRELVQNCHDGALQAAPAGCLRWVAEEPGSCSSFTCAVEGHGSETVARISYHPDQQRLILVNNDTGLQRKALLLGNSEKAESQQVVGQFGEGMKVGTLALLREGRCVEMRTRSEHWRWIRRVDEQFGVRVLTVAVSSRAEAVRPEEEEEEEADGDETRDYKSDDHHPPSVPSHMLPPATRAVDDDTSTVTTVEPLSVDEWTSFTERFLFLKPPDESFDSAELGSLLLDERHKGQLYVKGIWIADLCNEHGLSSGLNLKHLRLDRDRRAVVHTSDLESQAAALWVRAIDAKPQLAQRLYRILESDEPGADVRKVGSFLSSRPQAVEALAAEFFAAHGADAVPVSTSSAAGDMSAALRVLDSKLDRRIVLVSRALHEVLGQASGVTSLDDLRKASEDGSSALDVQKDGAERSGLVAWGQLDEEAKGVARFASRVVRAAGDPTFEVGLIDIVEEVRQRSRLETSAPARELSSPRVRLPFAGFCLEAVHSLQGRQCFMSDGLGGLLKNDDVAAGLAPGTDGTRCYCREALMIQRICRARGRFLQEQAPPQAAVHLSDPGGGALSSAAQIDSGDLSDLLQPGSSRANGAADDKAENEYQDDALLSGALHVLIATSSAFALAPHESAMEEKTAAKTEAEVARQAEAARRELLLQSELRAQEQAAESGRLAQISELNALRKDVDAARAAAMRMEVEQINELERLRLKAKAEHEVASTRRRLEQQVSELRAAKEGEEQRTRALTEELRHAKEARAEAELRLAAEREAHATWQQHMDNTLEQCRARLVARTERLLQIGLRLEGARSGSNGAGVDAARSITCEDAVEAIASELREERDAHLCAICHHAERTTVLLPCRHAVLCDTCAKTVRDTSGRCPLCRAAIEDGMRVFG